VKGPGDGVTSMKWRGSRVDCVIAFMRRDTGERISPKYAVASHYRICSAGQKSSSTAPESLIGLVDSQSRLSARLDTSIRGAVVSGSLRRAI